MAGGPPVYPLDIADLLFFFPNFRKSNEAADYVLNNNRGPGTFLLRPSSRNPNALTLTISTQNNMVRHVNVQQCYDNQGDIEGYCYFIIPERRFSSFSELHEYYTNHDICNLERINNMRLLNPLNRPAIQPPSVMAPEIPPLPQPGRASDASSNASFQSVGSEALLDCTDNESGRLSNCSSQSSIWNERGAEGGINISDAAPGSPQVMVNYSSDRGSNDALADMHLENAPPVPTRPHAEGGSLSSFRMTQDMDSMVQLGWCRPPMPLPDPDRPEDEEESDPYYAIPRPYKNHLEDLKQMLCEWEICDCGLRMLDAELVGGWTIHRSREPGTQNRVFFQHQDGNTTWFFPEAITDLLSVQQVQFLVGLCRDGHQDVPAAVQRRYNAIMAVSSPGNLTPSRLSSRSRSSSVSSATSNTSSLHRNAGLD